MDGFFGQERWRAPRERAGRLLDGPWSRSALAALAGALPALAFPAPSLWWLAPVALVPWMLLARGAPTARRAGWDGWCGGSVSCWRCITGCCRAFMCSP